MSKKIRLYGGHSLKWKDPGAVSGGFTEATINKTVAKAAFDFLSAFNCTVVDGTDITTSDNIAAAKKERVDALVCIHHNAGGGDGCEVFHWHTDNKSKELAEEINRQFIAIGQNSRGVKKSTTNAYNFAPCREMAKVGLVGVLGEYAFVDNAKDREIIDTEIDLINEGKAYGKALVKFLGLELKETAKPLFRVTTKDVINIRDAPGGNDIGDTKTTDIYNVLEIKKDNRGREWYFITFGWVAGWLCANYPPLTLSTTANKPTTTPPIIPEAMPEPVKPPEPVVQPEPIPQTPVIVPETPPIEPQTPEVKPVPVPMPVESALVKLIKAILKLFKA